MYGKLFAQMYDGTLGTKGPWQALVTFQQLVILADQQGVVDMTIEAIARRTTIPLEIITEGIQALEQPDPHSRSPALEGRRIERLNEDRDWGWHIVNYAHYRAIRTQDERREYMRTYQRQRRAGVKASTMSTGGKQSQPIAEAKAEGKAKTKAKVKNTVAPSALPGWLNPETWNAWVKVRPARARTAESLKACIAKLEKFRAAGHDPNEIVATSLSNGWQGLFAPKGGDRGTLAERNKAAGEEAQRRFDAETKDAAR